MKSKELRIGNYVIYNSEVVKVNSVGRVYLSHKKKYVSHKILVKDYLEIPLTEDWLVKFGFEEKDSRKNRFINRADFELEFQGDKVAYCVWGGEDAPHLTQFFGHCKYVHQLQNLYFALTNEELTIK